MSQHRDISYQEGPTTCAPAPEVLASIQRQISENRVLSRHELRLAAAMGLVSADALQPLGYNDGVFYPPERAVAVSLMAAAPAVKAALPTGPRTLHALALLVDFSDNIGKRPAADFAALLFDGGDPGSMTSYYRELSYGQLNVTGEAIGYVRAPQPYAYYTAGQSGTGPGFPQNTPGLLQDALAEFCKTDSLQRFDQDGDGYVDGIFLIHAGGGAEAEPDPRRRKDMIWSHKWVLPTPFVNQGVSVYAYSTEPEDGRVGVFAHEFGHVLGLPDLYDTSYRYKGIGDWCLMSGGSWGGGGDHPVRLSCWCLSKLKWIQPNVVTAPGQLTVPTLATSASACYRLWTHGQPGPEYFLLENRQISGRDQALPGSGLAVWHIDETRSDNTDPQRPLVGLMQADGNRDLENNRNGGDDGDLFPGSSGANHFDDSTNPSAASNQGQPTGVAVSRIADTNGTINVNVIV